jgi:hypothetical protein
MNTKFLRIPEIPALPDEGRYQFKAAEPLLLFVSLLLLWCFAPPLLQRIDQTVGNVDQSIWLLILLSLISFLLICAICWWLLKHCWQMIGLPKINMMVSQFKTLAIWQQLSFLWGSFALLLLAAMGCLVAIC